jgi:hypothetical protein
MEKEINWSSELKKDFHEEAFLLYTKEQKNIYEIKKILVAKGLSPEEAINIAEEVEHIVEIEIRGKAKGQLTTGIILFLIGCFVTFGSYSNAVERGGGMYIVTYGLILSGIASLIRGAYTLSKL